MIYDKQVFCHDFDVSRETGDRLEIYHGLLVKWQKAQNLVASNTLDHEWSRYFADCMVLFKDDICAVADGGFGACGVAEKVR